MNTEPNNVPNEPTNDPLKPLPGEAVVFPDGSAWSFVPMTPEEQARCDAMPPYDPEEFDRGNDAWMDDEERAEAAAEDARYEALEAAQEQVAKPNDEPAGDGD